MTAPNPDREQRLLEIRATVEGDHHHACEGRKGGDCDCYNRTRYSEHRVLLAAIVALEDELADCRSGQLVRRLEAERDEERRINEFDIGVALAETREMLEAAVARAETAEKALVVIKAAIIRYRDVDDEDSWLALLAVLSTGNPLDDDGGGSSHLCNCRGLDTGVHMDYCPLYAVLSAGGTP